MKNEKKRPDNKPLAKKLASPFISVAFTVVVISAVTLANIAASMFFERYSPNVDMTSDKRYTLSEKSLEYVKKIDTEVLVTVFADEKTFTDFNYPYNKQASELLKNYCRQNRNISYRFVNIDSNPDVARSYTDVNEMDIVFETKQNVDGKDISRTRKIGVCDIVNFDDRLVEALSNSGYTVQSYVQKEMEGSQAQFAAYFSQYIASTNAEAAFTSALMTVTDPEPVYVSFLTGRSELGDLSYMKTLLEANGYNVSSVDITRQDIPQDTDIIVIAAPQNDYMQADIDKINRFMDNEGKKGKFIVFFSHAAQESMPLLDSVIGEYGLAVGEGIVCENKEDMYYNQPYYTLSDEVDEYLLEDMQTANPRLLIAQSRPVNFVDTGNSSLEVYKLLLSSDSAFTAQTQPLVEGQIKVIKNEKQCYAALSIDRSTDSGAAVFGTSSFAEDQFMAYKQYANQDVILTLFNKISNKTPEIRIEPKVIAAKGFEITQAEKKVLKWTFILVIPLIVAAVGVTVTLKRKRR